MLKKLGRLLRTSESRESSGPVVPAVDVESTPDSGSRNQALEHDEVLSPHRISTEQFTKWSSESLTIALVDANGLVRSRGKVDISCIGSLPALKESICESLGFIGKLPEGTLPLRLSSVFTVSNGVSPRAWPTNTDLVLDLSLKKDYHHSSDLQHITDDHLQGFLRTDSDSFNRCVTTQPSSTQRARVQTKYGRSIQSYVTSGTDNTVSFVTPPSYTQSGAIRIPFKCQQLHTWANEHDPHSSDRSPSASSDEMALPDAYFSLYSELWSLSSMHRWLRTVTRVQGLEVFYREELVTSLVSLIGKRMPIINMRNAKSLSETIVSILTTEETPVIRQLHGHPQQLTCDNQIGEEPQGVFPQLAGSGCYSPTARTLHLKGPCYSPSCPLAGPIRLYPPRPSMTEEWQNMLQSRNLIPNFYTEQNWSGQGQNAVFTREEIPKIPLELERVLGFGACGVVESVRCRRIRLARKTVRCNRKMKREDAVKEVEHLQRLSHAHIVRLIGTYIIEDGKDLYILMYPVVDFDLERFLEKISDAAEDGAPQDFLAAADASLKSFFSCLVATLDFLQKRNVKHMDIKPKNILVRDVRQSILAHDCAYKVYLADFGIARAYSSPTESETTSPTAFTRLYSAPEIVAQETRGFKADVFSLGCVYAEMLATLARQRDQLDTTRQRSFQAEIPAVQQFLRELVFQEPEVYLWNTRSRAMTSQLPKDRPSAKTISKDHQQRTSWTVSGITNRTAVIKDRSRSSRRRRPNTNGKITISKFVR